MKVYVVIKNDKVDEVFSSEENAKYYAIQVRKKWNLTEIIPKEVLGL